MTRINEPNPIRSAGLKTVHGPNGPKLKQIQLRSYVQDIPIYHFRNTYITVSKLRSLLTRHDHGYVATLLSPDPLNNIKMPEGDETPPGNVEVAYLPNIFQRGGSALGFRVPRGKDVVVEWMCFNRGIKEMLLDGLDIDIDGERNEMGARVLLFEHVADLPKGAGKNQIMRANDEYKAWCEALRLAEHAAVRVSVTWRRCGAELRADRARKENERDRRDGVRKEVGFATDGYEEDGENGTYGDYDVADTNGTVYEGNTNLEMENNSRKLAMKLHKGYTGGKALRGH